MCRKISMFFASKCKGRSEFQAGETINIKANRTENTSHDKASQNCSHTNFPVVNTLLNLCFLFLAEGSSVEKGVRGQIHCKKCMHMYVNAKMIPIETIPGIREGG
jgi:hypothetical protein